MKLLIKKMRLITIFIMAISFMGCEDDAILPQIEADFTYILNADTGTVTFLNVSEEADTYVWTFGDETTSTEINPIKTYPTGSYTITLKASNVSGASDTFEDTVTINIPLPIGFPITFDDPNVSYAATTFQGTSFAVVANPAPGGTNDVASNVGAITNIGAAFEGIFFELGTPIDFTTLRRVNINFWADAPVDVLLKFEEGAASTADVIVSHDGTGWEELSFDLGSTSSYSKLVLFVDGPGTTSGTFYFDDLTQAESPIPPCTAETAQSLNAVDLDLTFLTDPGTRPALNDTSDGQFFQDNVTYEYADNPDSTTPANNSCKVGKVTKSGVQPWDNLQIDFPDTFTVTDGSTISMKVYSPVSGYKVTIKLEDKTTAGAVTSGDIESTTSTTTDNLWEELTIPISAVHTDKYDRLVIFFDLAGPANTNEYYFDDIKFNLGTGGGGGGGGGTCPAAPNGELLPNGDFEADACWQFNVNGGIAERSSEDANGGTFSAKLITGANQAPNIKVERFASTIPAGTTVRVTFKYKFTTALGTGSILQVLGFSEKTAGAVEHNMGNAPDTSLNTWATFTNTFVTAGDITEGLSLLLQLTGSGNADGAGAVFIDDVQVTQE